MAKKKDSKLNISEQELSEGNLALNDKLEEAAKAKLSEGQERLPDEISVKDYEKFIQSLIDKKEITGTSTVSVTHTAQKNAELSINRRMKAKVVATTAVFLIMLMFIAYLLALLLLSMGNFSVEVDTINPEWALSLSKDSNFSEPSNSLQAEPLREMRDMAFNEVLQVPDQSALLDTLKDLQSKSTQTEEDEFMLNTFYVRNDSPVDVNYCWELLVTEETKDLGKAVRILVIKNAYLGEEGCEYWFFAKANSDGTQPFVVEESRVGGNSYFLSAETINFQSDAIVASVTENVMQDGAVDVYTVILWIEGSDVDCDQSRLGGTLAVAMKLTILNQVD